jgi:hypothetical protein
MSDSSVDNEVGQPQLLGSWPTGARTGMGQFAFGKLGNPAPCAYLMVSLGLAIVLSTLSLNLLGDGLRTPSTLVLSLKEISMRMMKKY